MAEEQNHLTIEQLESVLDAHVGGREIDAELLRTANRHLASCENCQRLVSMHQSWDQQLRSLRAAHPAEAGADCPAEEELWQLACELVPKERMEPLLDHVVHCDHCGPAFGRATAIFSETQTQEESEVLGTLKGSKGEWQTTLAGKLAESSASKSAGVPIRSPRRVSNPWLWWALAAAAVMVIAIAGTWIAVNSSRSPELLLARAYTQQRTFELRVSGAAYAPLRVERGTDRSRLSRPPELLEAETIIAKSLRRKPHDPRWLHARGQADLLDNNLESALSSLLEAHRLSPDDPSISLDLATAYFQIAQSSDVAEDYNRAIDLLRAVTVRDPKNSVAWFNLGIACERMHYYTEALEIWDAYLRTDLSSPWADEARSRREEIRKRISEHQKGHQTVDSPAALVSRLRNQSVTSTTKLDQPVEVYVSLALSSWLPAILARNTRPEEKAVMSEAVGIIVSVAVSEDRDPWLKDLAHGLVASPSSRSALRSLNQAISSSEAGDYTHARVAAQDAEESFKRFHSVAGSMRARFEEIYALQLSQQGERCYAKARDLQKDLSARSYTWLLVQTELEAAICADMTGRLTEAKTNADDAFQLVKSVNYDSLYLRTVVQLAILDWTSGDFASATKLASEGLEKFWSAKLPAMRGYSLYSVLDSVAEDSELWFAQVTVDKEATRLLEGGADHGLLGFEYHRLATAAVHSGELRVGEKYFRRTAEEFALAAPGEALDVYRAASELGRARMEYLEHNYISSRSRLEKARTQVEASSNRFLALDFHLLEGDVFSALGDYDTALNSFLRATDIAEKGLEAFGSERDRLIWTRAYDRTYRALVKLQLATSPPKAFEYWEWYKAAPLRTFRGSDGHSQHAYFDRAIPREKLPPQQNTLTNLSMGGEVLLSYVLLSEESGVWVHTDGRIEYRRLAVVPSQLRVLASRFREECSNVLSDEKQIASDSRQLFDLLIKPILPLLRSRKVVIEADEGLEGVPFEALVSGENRFFGDDYHVATSPGLTYLSSTRPNLSLTEIRNALVVANPFSVGVGNTPLDLLPSANEEARDVAMVLPHSRLLLGPAVTTTALLTELGSADVFHFSGHAMATREGAALLLRAKDDHGRVELLGGRQLETLALDRTRLVVLSACATAGGKGRTFSEASSLVRTFLALGVPQVIATRWSVDSGVTRELMHIFYRHLLTGEEVSEALGQARQEVRRQNGFAHPYYWAAFSVFGKV